MTDTREILLLRHLCDALTVVTRYIAEDGSLKPLANFKLRHYLRHGWLDNVFDGRTASRKGYEGQQGGCGGEGGEGGESDRPETCRVT